MDECGSDYYKGLYSASDVLHHRDRGTKKSPLHEMKLFAYPQLPPLFGLPLIKPYSDTHDRAMRRTVLCSVVSRNETKRNIIHQLYAYYLHATPFLRLPLHELPRWETIGVVGYVSQFFFFWTIHAS